MTMITIKTADLIGPALDWAVGGAIGLLIGIFSGVVYRADQPGDTYGPGPTWNPSTDWSQGGPLIDKHRLEFVDLGTQGFACVRSWDSWPPGQTHLVAACRAIVAAKLGDEVQVPAELVQGGAQ